MSEKINPIQRVLIANRGEIAVRIIRALRDLGKESVAIYSDADQHSQHIKMADYAIRLPGTLSADTYLKIEAIQEAILASKADAVHPGYGFLSESILFRKALAEMPGVRFIGPGVEAMQQMGDKVRARNLMIKSEVPVVPGVAEPLASVEALQKAVKDIGYPLILKAAAGGGGRGMRIVREDSELKDAYEACTREAVSYFGNPDVFCERYIENPRHIEIQVLLDEHGNGVHLFERDCSVQRRHQKLFEEAPSSFLNDDQRNRLGEIAVRAGKACGYSGAGTVEFICESPDRAYFMEMNTRIQVEHPVTEEITGVDLIRSQIEVAEGQPLGFSQQDISLRGWSMEARINAEDAAKGFLPAPGLVTKLKLPQGPGIRVDTHLYEGYEIPGTYDSMVAKLIVTAKDRDAAIQVMQRALAEFELEGIPSTIPFHEALLSHPQFCSGDFTTSFLVEQEEYFKKVLNQSVSDEAMQPELLAAIAAILAAESEGKSPSQSNRATRDAWQQKARGEATLNS